jgi:outer membrane protein assembly factor BamB
MSRSLSCTLILLGTSLAWADNWPSWRGLHANGISDERTLPLTWSVTQNIRWKVPLPEPGNSTPVVWGDRIFLTQSLDKGKRRALIAYRRADGKKLWQQEVPCKTEETTASQNPPCSASPVTDGAAIYAHFASAGVIACDLDGKRLWHRDLGPVLHQFGNGPSPILFKDLLLVFHGPGTPTFLIALDKHTGKTVWQKQETAINSNLFGSWSTPVVLRLEGHDELILPLPGERIGGDGEVKAYDPATGKERWRCRGLGNEIYASPVVSPGGDLVLAISGHSGPLMAVRPGGKGDVTNTHRLWRTAGKNPQRVGTGVIHDGRLYLADAPGFVECLEAQTGKVLWKERVGGNLWGSMLLAGGKLYVTSLEGETLVLEAGPKFRLLARNAIQEPTYAALAVSDGELFLRTWGHLYRIGRPK